MTLIQDLAGNHFTKVNSFLAGIWGIDGAVLVELDGNGQPDFEPWGIPLAIHRKAN